MRIKLRNNHSVNFLLLYILPNVSKKSISLYWKYKANMKRILPNIQTDMPFGMLLPF